VLAERCVLLKGLKRKSNKDVLPVKSRTEDIQKSPLLHALLENVAKAIIPQTEEKTKTK